MPEHDGQPGARSAGTPAPGLLRLQRLAGNRAVGMLLQRAVQDDAGPVLTSPLLAGDARVGQAVHNAPPLRLGEHSEGVARLQHGLVTAGYDMPRSTLAAGEADGKYGAETQDTVRRFQTDHGVAPVGGHEAGHRTLTALDRELVDLGSVEGGSGAPGGKATVSKPRETGPNRLPGHGGPQPPAATAAHGALRTKEEFEGRTFTEPAFHPDNTAASQFLVRFTQATQELLIGVKARADFRHSAGIVRADGEAKAHPEDGVQSFYQKMINLINFEQDEARRISEVERWRWQATPVDERLNWAAALRQAIETAWSASTTQIQFVLDKPGFPATRASVVVQVEVDDLAGRQIAAGPKVPAADRHLDMVVWKAPAGVGDGGKDTSTDKQNVHSLMRLSSNSVVARSDNELVLLWRPEVPLSNVEGWAAGHMSAATRLGSRTAPDRKVPDAAGQPISMVVRGPDAATRTSDTVDLIKAITNGCGDASRIRRLGEADGPRGAGLFVGDGKGQVTAAHEFGHLFGLGDEYSEGSFRGTGDAASHSAQAANMGPGGPAGAMVENNDNIMSEGDNIRPEHYATFLDALRKVTGLQEWRLL
ncbi:MAG: peptidoglycan-binding domain-containing protein [Kibdelosporangium sp.]